MMFRKTSLAVMAILVMQASGAAAEDWEPGYEPGAAATVEEEAGAEIEAGIEGDIEGEIALESEVAADEAAVEAGIDADLDAELEAGVDDAAALPIDPSQEDDHVADGQEEKPAVVEATVPAQLDPADSVIKDQLEAIRKRNDRAAYELSATGLQEDYEDPQSFMRMVRREKPSLYDHVAYEILGAKTQGSKFHRVRLTDKYGRSAMAMFKMEQDAQGEWRTRDIIVLQYDNSPI